MRTRSEPDDGEFAPLVEPLTVLLHLPVESS